MLCLVQAVPLQPQLIFQPLTAPTASVSTARRRVIYSGYSVSSAGDINGDGYDDLIIGAIYADPNGTSSGSSYVVFGTAQCFCLHS